MNGYKVTVYRLRDDPDAKDSYMRERSDEIYEQKVAFLDVRALVQFVNSPHFVNVEKA